MNDTVTDKKKSPRLKTVLFLVFAWILIFALLGGMTWFTNKWIVRLTPYHYELRGIDRWYSSDFFANEEYAEAADEEYAEAADEEAFLSSYPPRDCDYYYDYYERAPDQRRHERARLSHLRRSRRLRRRQTVAAGLYSRAKQDPRRNRGVRLFVLLFRRRYEGHEGQRQEQVYRLRSVRL